ncbi:hypothetical protein [Paenibacillus sp. yr247]|uniref:hypothetical protein n=1 Tax=Paenibacillus sp. yr247 TaxID=1761880 RepID=UPI002675521B|nr:hypothetical protein [Paenibacillus sp. yr247]
MLKSDLQPLTPKHLGMKLISKKPKQTVIMDGNIKMSPWLRQEEVEDGYIRNWLS